MHMYLFNPCSLYSSNPNGVTLHSHSVDAEDISKAARMYAIDYLPNNVGEVKHGEIVEVWASMYDDNTCDFVDCGKVAIKAWIVVEHSISIADGPFN